jgi:hypothetical protein
MTVELEEFAPNRWRVAKNNAPPRRSALPFPMVISDEMDACEQVNGKWYTSKSEFRKIGRSLGLVEVGTEKPKPHVRSTDKREVKQARQQAIKKAVAQVRGQ